MLGKMKQWLGIEGVKLELTVPGGFDLSAPSVDGTLRLYSKNEQTVSAVRLVLIERYSRGREPELLVDEYLLGELVLRQPIVVPAEGQMVEVPFSLPFHAVRSEVEEFGRRNLVFKGLAWVAKKTRNAVSEYRLEAEAQVPGVGLNPYAQLPLE